MSLTELLLQAKSKGSQEFLFIVGSEPRVRTSQGWEILRNSPGLITEWRLLQQSFLDSVQATDLENSGQVHGETSFENLRMGFSFFQKNETMKALIDLDVDGSTDEIHIPPSVIETCVLMKGLMILSGSGESGQAAALFKLITKMSEEKSFLGAVFSAKPFPQVREAKATLLYHSGVFSGPQEKESFLAGVDLVIYHGESDESSFLDALALAERGIFVIYSMKGPSITNSLRRCLSVLTKKFDHHGPSRLADVFTLGCSQYAMNGINNKRVFAHEVLLAKPQVRELIENENIKGLELLASSAPENSGILTLNQSILQHLIRRRVSLKVAFETSRDPDSLDQLLKKVGI